MRRILTTFIFQEIPNVVQLTYATEYDLASSIIYLLKEDVLHRKRNLNRVIILRDIDTLNITSCSTIGRLIKELKGVVGIVGTISSYGFDSLKIKGEEYTDIGDFVTDSSVQWEELAPPKREELFSYCIARGVLAERLVNRTIEKSPNFRLLDREIEDIKRKLKEKGFLKDDI